MIRRPMIGLAVAGICGTACGLATTTAAVVPLAAVAGLLGLAGVRLIRARHAEHPGPHGRALDSFILLTALALLAWARASPEGRGVAPIPEAWRGPNAAPPVLEVAVVGDPKWYPSATGRMRRLSVPLHVVGVGDEASPEMRRRPFVGTVWWHVFDRGPAPRYGDRWRLEGVQWPARDPWFPELNRHARVYPRQAQRLARHEGHPFVAWCYEARRQLGAHLTRGVEDFSMESGILRALLLGNRSLLTREVRDIGAATGTLHIFAISGQHVAILTGLCLLALRLIGVARPYWFWVLAPAVIAYTVLTGAAPSAVRAGVMALVYLAAPAWGRRPDGATSLAFAALAILLAAPQQLRDVGFIYSFVVVLGLIAWFPLIAAWTRRLTAPDPLRVQPSSRLVRAGRVVGRDLLRLAGLSAVAWAASVPVTAYYFERFTPVALVANLAVVPLAFLMVFCGCLSVVFGSVVDVFAEIFNFAAVALIRVFLAFTRLLAASPGADLYAPRPALWQLGAYYLVAAAFTAWVWDRHHAAVRRAEAAEAAESTSETLT